MAFEIRPNSGSAFKNKRKERDSHADLTGDGMIEVECPHCGKSSQHSFWINLWKKIDKNKDTWLSVSFNKKRPRSESDNSAGPKPSAKSTAEDIDDDIPF